MASLKDIRGRIGSVRNIAQITRAMEMVAASRMKRAQDAILAARPYSDELRAALSRVAAVVGEEVHPLLARRPVKRVALIMITTDRGLAGSLNANAIRAALRWTQQKMGSGDGDTRVEVEAITIGRKGRDGLRRAGIPIAAHFQQLGDRPSFSDVTPIARLVTEDFLEGRYDEIDVAYSTFISTLTQRPEITPLLPIVSPEQAEGAEVENDEYLFEPSPEAVLSRLLPHYVAIDLYRAVLENQASEQSARMIAMRNSTDNANELIDDLTLVYNKTRQATITREMIEIASGAEALGG
ncbi:MAG: ATP synthase F1 subunit gamma [Chloroflexota bacterium]|jgi:F-type H+-transporting ATPase subunit gamma|nr:ATP synthase F1 subunit gamma [Chloroflexota bacterium]